MTAKQLIYDLLSPLTEATLVWAYQGRHVPPRPYIAMYRMNNRSGQWDYESPVDVDGNVTVSGMRRTRLELQCFADDPEDLLETLKQKLRTPSSVQRGVELGISVHESGQVENLPSLREDSEPATYEPRAVFELTLGWVHATTDNVGLIERVEYDAEMADRTTHHTVEVTTNGEA